VNVPGKNLLPFSAVLRLLLFQLLRTFQRPQQH
jgi:hypothetical protein